MSDSEVNENEDTGNEQEVAASVISSPGAQLASFRQAHGWSIEQVAAQLNLAPRQIQALENDQYSALPGMPIVRGFIRAYAKLLKIDPALLLALMPGESVAAQQPLAPRNTLSTPFSEARLPSITDRRGWSGAKIGVAVAVVVLLIAGTWVVRHSEGLAPLLGLLAPNVEKITESAPVALPSEPVEPIALNLDVAPPAVTPEPQNAELGMPSPPALEPAPEPVVQKEPEPTQSDKDMLVFKVREDSWVEIRRADKSLMVSRLFKAGSTETFSLAGPASVVIGNASGVDATLRGEPLDLKTRAGNNVARLSLK